MSPYVTDPIRLRGDKCEWWAKMAANFEDFKKIMFCSIAKFFSQNFLFKCVLSVKKIIFFRLWALSTLDLASGFNQVAIDPVHKTAFITPFGLYEYNRCLLE